MSLYSKFCAWLSGWPESSQYGRDDREQDYIFAEEEAMIRENNKNIGKKPKGLKPKKKKKSKK
tara:strand:- start:10 stop:198 length:189 start_codon:yes stop_codon:yes gene_type:complete